ncbi:hypothetical protein F934_00416 [Acinetobacter beijerinckii ANC 3835]|uniref:site-specific DNA-methyltransferase (adenine-specific) n=1 Tax=Acinetobacter beijerinckii ANC 3835 TaxID=1217649 RepID=N9FTF3_9GAMM|nr:hypothetical protein F934_00416 [Acinetobacter beijerinckii ANC 3835]
MRLGLELDETLGQVWTPDEIANEMAREAFVLIPNAKKILDPACGPATFSKAINQLNFKEIELICYDVDPRMHNFTSHVNQKIELRGETRNQDYLLDSSLENSFDLVIMNPPYIRQELIEREIKERYHQYLGTKLGVSIDKKSNLFALFLLKGILDLAPNGILCAIVFDAVQNSAYGKKTLDILNKYAELISTKTVATPFKDVLIDAQILLYRKRENQISTVKEHCESKDNFLIPLEELLKSRRGTALPKRAPFLANTGDKYYKYSSPFFIKQSRLEGLVIKSDQRIYLTNSEFERVADYQQWMKERLEKHNLSENQKNVKPVKGSIAFNYYIRNAPRHLWNKDNIALSDNFYVSEPKGDFPAEVAWLLLNSDQYLNRLIASARNQGNGLRKLQLYEYKNVLLPNWNLLSPVDVAELSHLSKSLIQSGAQSKKVQEISTDMVKKLMDL